MAMELLILLMIANGHMAPHQSIELAALIEIMMELQTSMMGGLPATLISKMNLQSLQAGIDDLSFELLGLDRKHLLKIII